MHPRNHSTVTEFILLGLSSDPLVQIALFHIFLMIYMTTLTGNVLLIVAVRTDKRLHTSMYMFLSSLSFLDICFTSFTIPNTLVQFLLVKKSISFTGCAVQLYFATFLGMTECFLLAFMSYDRYIAICSPLHYNTIMSIEVSLWMISMSWLTASLLTFIGTYITFTLNFCGPNIINHFFCELPLVLELSCSDISPVILLKRVVTIIVLLTPLSLILLSYIRIISAIMTIHTEKNKAFSTCVSHLVVVVIFYGTAMFMYSKPDHLVTPDTDKKVAVFYTVVTPMLNPLIYSLRNKDVQRSMKRLLLVVFIRNIS